MRSITRAVVTAAMLLALAGQTRAQMPFEGPRDMSKPPACTKDYIAGLDLQVKALDKVRTAGPELVGQVCTLI
ncbi:hypothetical protein, partial [Enterococcus faecium]